MTLGLINCTTEAVDSDGDTFISTASEKIKEKLRYMTIISGIGIYVDRIGNKGEYALGVFGKEKGYGTFSGKWYKNLENIFFVGRILNLYYFIFNINKRMDYN